MIQPFLAAFSGTAVEFFETAVIAYAIVRAGHPREAITAVVVGHVLVFALAVPLVPLRGVLPLFWLRAGAAALLTAMGLHWTLKSWRRMRAQQRPRWAEDPLGKLHITTAALTAQGFSGFVFVVMLKSSIIEAIEILIVVFPIAAATSAWSAVLSGVAAGIVAVLLLAMLLHGQLKKIPEVKLKLLTGLLLTTIGVLWLVELGSAQAS
jgi:uncharacterized membrane protein